MTNNSRQSATKLSIEWKLLVQGIAAGCENASVELYSRLGSMRYYFARRLNPQEADDRFHDVILAVIIGIRQGAVREPERLAGYAQAIARRYLANRIDELHRERGHGTEEEGRTIPDPLPDPEQVALRREEEEIARRVLVALPERDREVLIRFYLDGCPAERVQQEMGITATQFRLIKSRAKTRFAILVKDRLALRSVAARLPRGTGRHRQAPRFPLSGDPSLADPADPLEASATSMMA